MSDQHATQAEAIVAGLGGKENIEFFEACITRLRVQVRDRTLVNDDALKSAGAFGVVKVGTVIQVVVGPEADEIADEIGQLP
ncbi:PTS glucose/sucrose transporter subunit IIB [Actinomyces sp.]|uniref:PTS glucose/sucrose transporter subunit IIB n=1 Tax=Actinomyces sp. TaxID=29317 RepID=UPI001D40057C|nr:PTS glucose/sucrose transporter subunit IIB [Actinomyces sp.]MBS6101326.1 PTS glucose/sucrose transporter subunit IIB [Actinomyces sp.]MDU5569519.1 PTS glucose/sucrose transporter subunit IIB [Actinomyces sp.]